MDVTHKATRGSLGIESFRDRLRIRLPRELYFKKKIKASKRWRKVRKQISKLQNKVANQRQDWRHKVAAQIVSGNSLVATEKLNILLMP
ncbi:transposase [Fischerella thermalis]|uniref:transposase n=1 Tax=Fischerella thermalis TaxID=372787 RepID=UPI003078003B